MVGQSCIATDLELIYYVQNGQKGIVIYEKYIHIYIQITRLLPISFGSIDIKESAVGALVSSILNLNVGGTVITPPPSFDDSSKLQNIGPLREGLTGEDVVETQGLEQG